MAFDLPGNFRSRMYGLQLVVGLFFLCLLALGAHIHDDYGANWDLKAQMDIGIANYDFATSSNPYLFEFKDRYYGPVFELFLHIVTRQLESRNAVFTRYLLTYLLFWISLIAFYGILHRLTGKWYLALLGCLMLALSPRIFGDAFHNSKDIPFLSFFIISVYTLMRLAQKMTVLNAILHALSTALLIATRVPGILIVGLTFLYLPAVILFEHKAVKAGRLIALMLLYLLLTSALTVLFWPVLWKTSLTSFINALVEMSSYPWLGETLYKGAIITGRVPWTYAPTWILITTPLIILSWALAGGLITLVKAFKNRSTWPALFLMGAWFGLPLLIVIGLKSTLYDGWRQLYFIYPALVAFAVLGFGHTLQRYKTNTGMRVLLLIVTVAGLAKPAQHMLRYHPLEAVYFNRFAGASMPEIKQRYELDYWGISYRQALEWILANDDRPNIPIKFWSNEPGPGYANSLLFPLAERARIDIVQDLGEADYFVTNYRLHPQPFDDGVEVFSVEIDGASILSVYRLK